MMRFFDGLVKVKSHGGRIRESYGDADAVHKEQKRLFIWVIDRIVLVM